MNRICRLCRSTKMERFKLVPEFVYCPYCDRIDPDSVVPGDLTGGDFETGAEAELPEVA